MGQPKAEQEQEPTKAIAVAPDPAEAARSIVTERARGLFDVGTVDLIRQTVASECTVPELALFLELAARYKLDPLAKHIWAAKIGGKLTIFASHAGLLHIATESTKLAKLASGVVHANDEFEVVQGLDGVESLRHKITGSKEDRGEMIGAWCNATRTDGVSQFFFAHWSEYQGDASHARAPWKKYPTAMIEKCAHSVVLRRLFSIAGLVGEDEMAGQTLDRDRGREEQDASAPAAGIEYGDDERIAERLRFLMDLLDWPPRKRQIKLAGLASDDERLNLIRSLEAHADTVMISHRQPGWSDEPIEDVEVVPEKDEAVSELESQLADVERALEGTLTDDERERLAARRDSILGQLAAA